jgi:hypothetical protein
MIPLVVVAIISFVVVNFGWFVLAVQAIAQRDEHNSAWLEFEREKLERQK